MAIKMYKKKQLSYKNGYVIKDDKVVGIDNEVVDLFNKLERDYQKAMWDKVHPVLPQAQPEEFRFATEHGKTFVNVQAETPNLDAAVEQAMKLVYDLDTLEAVNKINDYMEGIHPIIQFVNDKRIVSLDQPNQHRFDLKFIGNPLELDKDALLSIVTMMFE